MNWSTFLNPLGSLLTKIFGFCFGVGKVLVAIGGLLFTIGGMLWAFVDVNGGLDGIANGINSVSAVIHPMPIAPLLSLVNRVFPLNELLVMEASLLFIYVSCVIVRWIVSFLPGLRG